MRKILIATDTTSGFTIAEAEELGIGFLPLSVIVEEQEFKDLYEISTEEIYDYDKKRMNLSTTQPNLGYLQETLQKWRSEEWQHIIIITLSSTFSGTYQAVKMMVEETGMDNVDIIDSFTVATPMKEAVRQAVEMVKEDRTVAEIVENCQRVFNNTTSYLFPYSLDNLKRGGRITPAAAAMSNLLKIKPLLFLENQGGKIDKHSVHRTENSVFNTIIKGYQEKGITADSHKIYLLHSYAAEVLESFIPLLEKSFPGIEYEVLYLPAVLTCHAGVGAFATQSVIKRNNS